MARNGLLKSDKVFISFACTFVRSWGHRPAPSVRALATQPRTGPVAQPLCCSQQSQARLTTQSMIVCYQ